MGALPMGQPPQKFQMWACLHLSQRSPLSALSFCQKFWTATLGVQHRPSPTPCLCQSPLWVRFHPMALPIPVQISPAPSACSAPGGKKVPKGNPERCRDYRKRQKTKKEKEEQELRQLDAKNRALKAKETVLRNKISRIKDAACRMGLGNYFN